MSPAICNESHFFFNALHIRFEMFSPLRDFLGKWAVIAEAVAERDVYV
jgi:hypothetical protein